MRPLPSLRPALCRGELRKVNKTQTIRFGSARYSLPTEWVGKVVEVSVVDHGVVLAYDGRKIDCHPLMAPGEVSIKDEHYKGKPRVPARAIRVRTGTERAFIALGPAAEAFLRSAAATGSSRLAAELADIVTLERSWGPRSAADRLGTGDSLSPLPGQGCARHPGRGLARSQPRTTRQDLEIESARSPRPTSQRIRLGEGSMTAPAPALAPDLVAGLRRLKLARVRVIAPDVCQTAKTQRWAPDEFLRTLIEAEIAARDESNLRGRIKQAGFPVVKSLDDFKVQASSVPQATFNYIAGLEWIRAKENLCLVGPAGTGKSHLLVGVGHAAVQAGLRVRYFTASDLVETLYRGLADNSVGRVIDNLLRVDLVILDELGFAPLDPTGSQLFFRFIAAAYERRSLGLASHWPFDQWGHFLPDETTAVSMIDRILHHAVVVVTEGESFRMKEAKTRGGELAKKKA